MRHSSYSYFLCILLVVGAQPNEDLDVDFVVTVLPQVDMLTDLPPQAQALGVPLKAVMVRHENLSVDVSEDTESRLCKRLFKASMCSAFHCPLGHYCLEGLPPALCPNNTYGPIEGLTSCLPCPSPMLAPPGSTDVMACALEGLEMQWVPLRVPAPILQGVALWPQLSAFYGVDEEAFTLG
jgi:hypothetical protein